MTPQEKAKELVEKFWPFVEHVLDGFHDIELEKENSKQCALIAVELVLSTRAYSEDLSGYDKVYWQQLKQEIEIYK